MLFVFNPNEIANEYTFDLTVKPSCRNLIYPNILEYYKSQKSEDVYSFFKRNIPLNIKFVQQKVSE